MSNKLVLHKILKGIFHTEEYKTRTNTRGHERIKLKRGTDEPMRAKKISCMFNSVNQ
jgi:hypothetical protein